MLKYSVFSDRAPCTNLDKGEQKDRTESLAGFADNILNDYGCNEHRGIHASKSVVEENFISFRISRIKSRIEVLKITYIKG